MTQLLRQQSFSPGYSGATDVFKQICLVSLDEGSKFRAQIRNNPLIGV
jgi:hypothetical protein